MLSPANFSQPHNNNIPKDPSRADVLLAELCNHVDKRPPEPDSRKQSWISNDTWKLVDQKAEARKIGNTEQTHRLKRVLKQSLKKDRKARLETVASTAEAFLVNRKIEKAYGVIRGWYKTRSKKPPKPTFRGEEATRREYEILFTDEEPKCNPIPIIYNPPEGIDDQPLDEGEIVAALKKSPGASGIRVEDLREWHRLAREIEEEAGEPLEEDVEIWEKVLELVNIAFTTGEVPRAFCYGVLVLIPKSTPGEYRGIALLEVIYKLVSAVINNRLREKISFHDAIHGFRTKRGTGTALIEAKLRMQLTMRTRTPLFMIFLDLKKAYDTLDRTQAIRILEGYGVGPRLIQIIKNIWEGDTMVTKQAGYFGRPFRAKRGVRLGDILSPMIFNIMMDAVIRYWESEEQEEDRNVQFYADDGLLCGPEGPELQCALDFFATSFRSLRLEMNAKKTEYMVMTGGISNVYMSNKARVRKNTGVGETYNVRAVQKVTCGLCGKQVCRHYLPKHQTKKSCIDKRAEYTAPEPALVPTDDSEDELETVVAREPVLCEVSMPGKLSRDSVQCPSINCPYSSNDRNLMRNHFAQCHIGDKIRIQEEGLLTQCNRCGFQSSTVLTAKHLASKKCAELSLQCANLCVVSENS